MISAQVETYADVIEHLAPVLPVHWEELALNKDAVPLDPDYEAYRTLEATGRLVIVTLREAGRIIGYFIGVCAPHLHYRTCLTLTMDIFYLHPAHRDGSPRAALTLFAEVEREARRRGVQRWVVGCKLHRNASALFRRLGFTPIETFHSKWLGG
jgi:L-amino acid N-acyltransferase YncA